MNHDTSAPAVILGLDTMQGLQAARILAARGIPVYAIVNDRRHHSARTRVCREIVEVPADDDLLDALERLGRRLATRAVLVPCHDRLVLLVSAHRERLSEWFDFVLPDHGLVEELMDKAAFTSLARRTGLPVPATFTLEPGSDIDQVADTVRYPCVLKPSYRTKRWADVTTSKGFKVESPQALRQLYGEYGPLADELLVQEWIEGPVSELYSFNGYFDRDGVLLASFVARKLRQWPPDTGQSSSGEEVRDDAVRQMAVELFEQVKYKGLAYVEIKRDVRTGEYFIVEPNVGRPTGRSAIAEGGGVELLYTAYCDALGLPLPERRQQTYTGVKWIHLRRDLQSVLATRRRDGITLRSWVRSIHGPKVYAVFSWTDPLPFIFDLLEAVRALRSRRGRAERGSTAFRPGEAASGQAGARWPGRRPIRLGLMETLLGLRGWFYRGGDHRCPCCGRRVRGFTAGGGSFRPRSDGYCPRCNAKGRHRRVALFLDERGLLDRPGIDLLHVAPKYGMYRKLSRLPDVRYTSIDLTDRPEVTVVADLTELPFPDGSFDAVVNVHVLEHVADDAAAIREMFRVLRPGGWAVVNVPMRLGRPTVEDPGVSDPEERRRLFGEPDHVRWYGDDLVARLRAPGFDVELFPAEDVEAEVRRRHGIPVDEHVAWCVRPVGGS